MTEDEMAAEIESLKGRLHAALNFGRAWMDKSKKADVTIADLRKQLEKQQKALEEALVTMRHAHVFVRSRERIHQDGLALYNDCIQQIIGALPLTDDLVKP